MRKYIYICSLFFTLALQPAYAQKYEYTGHTPPTYITIKGEQYVRIPHPHETKFRGYPSKLDRLISKISQVKPYIGTDIGYNKLNRIIIPNNFTVGGITNISFSTQLPKNIYNLSANMGLKVSKNISLEAFYQDTFNRKEKGDFITSIPIIDATSKSISSSQLSFNSYGLDFIYSAPLYNQSLEILIALGIGFYDIDAKLKLHKWRDEGEDVEYFASNKSIGHRIGFGGQYNFNEHLSLRGMVRYIKFTDDKIIKDMLEFSTGLRYYF